jgi:ribonuclease HI
VNEVVDALAQSAARGVAGPGEREVIAALKRGAVLR